VAAQAETAVHSGRVGPFRMAVRCHRSRENLRGDAGRERSYGFDRDEQPAGQSHVCWG
jgi:hypothetical protein